MNRNIGMMSNGIRCSAAKGVIDSAHIFTPGSARMSCRDCVGGCGP